MIHDTAQGQTQYDLCEKLRAQITAYATKLGAESYQVCYLEDRLAASQAREVKLREIVAKMRADLKAIGGFENRFSGQPAVNIREYIFDLEGALDPIDDTALQQRLAEERAKVLKEIQDAKD